VNDRHPEEARLNDYLDGLLDGTAEVEVHRHLEACPSCREQVESIGRLLEIAAELPRDVAPPPSLWPAVAARTVDRPPVSIGRRSLRSVRWELAAAATVLVALSSLLTALVVGGPGQPGTERPGTESPAVAASGGGTPVTSPARLVESEYGPTVAKLRAELEARRAQLSPATVEAVEANLRIIDQAIATTEAALAADPGSQPGASLLTAMYRKKIGVLEQTLRFGT
jgi:anti-sigma factor RsiW